MSETNSEQPLVQDGEVLRLNDWADPVALMLAFCAVGAGLLLLLTGPAHGSNLNGSLRPVLGFAWIAFGLMAVSGLRAGLIVEEQGIVVRSRVRTASYLWSDIRHFELQESKVKNALRIELKDGRQVSVRGFNTRSQSEVSTAEAMVAELNRRVPAS